MTDGPGPIDIRDLATFDADLYGDLDAHVELILTGRQRAVLSE